MLYPDDRYFADSDRFGMEDNDEEEVWAIIDTDLKIIEPFRPVKDVRTYLNGMRREKCERTEKEEMLWRAKIEYLFIFKGHIAGYATAKKRQSDVFGYKKRRNDQRL